MGHGLFFPSQGDALYGFLHPAEGGPRATGVLFVHGAFEERQDAHLVTRAACEALAARGFDAMRFDLYGHGDSAGDYADATLARWVADTLAAREALAAETGCRRVALVGTRLGAAVVARAARALAAQGRPAERLVLWQPVVHGETYLAEVLRTHLASEMVMRRRAGSREALLAQLRASGAVNIGGYALTAAMYDEIAGVDLAADLAAAGAPALLLDVVRQAAARGAPELDALAAALGDRVTLRRVVEGQPLFTEGKLFYARADNASAATGDFLAAAP